MVNWIMSKLLEIVKYEDNSPTVEIWGGCYYKTVANPVVLKKRVEELKRSLFKDCR